MRRTANPFKHHENKTLARTPGDVLRRRPGGLRQLRSSDVRVLDEKNLERDDAPSSTGLSQPVIPEEGAFRKLDLDTNGAVTWEGWHFDTNNGANGNFGTLDENGLQINFTKFLTQSPKHFQLYSIFGGSDQTNNNTDFSWDGQQFQPQGLRLFSVRF